MKGFIQFFIGSLVLLSGAGTASASDVADYAVKHMEIVTQQSNPDSMIKNTEEPDGVITIDEALNASLKMHPGLAASLYNIKAFDGIIQQAGTFPNPSLSGELEEFGGSGEFKGTNMMSSKIGISQTIPIGGQISRRINAARADKNIAEVEYIEEALALETEVKKRFLSVYRLQEKLKLEKENLELTRSLKNGIVKRVTAGEASPLDEVKVTVEMETADIEMERTNMELEAAKHMLASSWAGETVKFTEVASYYNNNYEIPDEKDVMELLQLNPSYWVLEKKVTLASANLELSISEAWMDIEVGGGIQRFNETKDHSYFLEINIPIPLFNRNRGNIEGAIQTKNRARMDLEAGAVEFKANLVELIKRLHSVKKAWASMEITVMPAAKKAFDAVRKAYQVGEQDYVELVEARRTYLTAKHESLDLFMELHTLIIELESFTAGGLKGFTALQNKMES